MPEPDYPVVHHPMHFALDIETLGTAPGSVILSIAAVPFVLSLEYRGRVLGELDPFYAVIAFEDATSRGLLSARTMHWWLRPEQRAALNAAIPADQDGLDGEKTVLERLANYLRATAGDQPFWVWGNGASFDCGLLSAAYARHDMDLPWGFWRERDMRTLGQLVTDFGDDGAPERTMPSLAHDALEDAAAQAQTIVDWWNYLRYRVDDDVVTPL